MAASNLPNVGVWSSSQDGPYISQTTPDQKGSTFEGEGGLTGSAFTGATGSDSSPVPSRAEPPTGTATLDPSPQTVPPRDLIHHQNYYLERVAKVAPPEAKSACEFFTKKCGQWFMVGECPNGHRFAVKLNCRKPYCPICGDIEHQRKIASLLPEVQQMKPVGYLVIRPPNELQVFYLNRYARRRIIKAVIKALKSLGYRRGLVFTHYFGKDPTKFAFHLNVLLDGEWLEPEQLDQLKCNLRRLIYPEWVIKKWGDKLDINYSYRQSRAEIMHTLRYCTHPTFTQLEGNERLADSIRGEHAIRRWGKWDEQPKWQLDDTGRKVQALVSLEKGECPICGEHIVWGRKPVPLGLLPWQIEEDLGGDYYRLRTIRPPPWRSPIPQLKAS